MARGSVVEIISQLLIDWAEPREPAYLRAANVGLEAPERCTAEVATGPPVITEPIPDDLREFWTAFATARLFEDVNFGQWGLVLFDPVASDERTREFRAEQPQDVAPGDRVIGRFLGDTDLLVIRCDTAEPDFGTLLVAVEGFRDEWYRVADSLSAFLEEYASYDGQKYWETQFRGRR